MDLGFLFQRLERSAFPLTGDLVDLLGRLARKGGQCMPFSPRRRRLVLLQIDGLSGARFERALAAGEMPCLARRVEQGQFKIVRLRAATAPSTPVFQAGMLYGIPGDLPGFAWHDRALGRTVRMDLAEDVEAVESELIRGPRRSLLDGGSSYGTILHGNAADAFFNVLRWGRDATIRTCTRRLERDLYDVAATLVTAGAVTARMAVRAIQEVGASALDLWRFFRRHNTTRFEWRFLYMRLFVSVIMRDIATHSAVLDVLRGAPVIFIDYLDYDEYAHRRGPDSTVARWNLPGIDAGIERIAHAVEQVPEYGYELYVLSDHGQSNTTPFERVMGDDLATWVLTRVAADRMDEEVPADDVRELVKLRDWQMWLRSNRRPLRVALAPWLDYWEHRLGRRLGRARTVLDAVEVVTGGSIAHLYLTRDNQKLTVGEMDERCPTLLCDVSRCPAIGLAVARSTRGPVVLYRGRRYRLADRAALAPLEPFRTLGYDVLAGHLATAVECSRSGDLVVYGAFAERGNISFDFEFGSHGGVHPEELDQFFLYPAHVPLDKFGDAESVRAEDFNRFFRRRHDAWAA